jgi:hypothetical protein
VIMRSVCFFVFGSLAVATGCSAKVDEATAQPSAAPAGAQREAQSPDEELPSAQFCQRQDNERTPQYRFRFDALEPVRPYDYLALLLPLQPQAYAGQDDEFRVDTERGAMCGAATDIAACKAAYAAIPKVTATWRICFTRGDEVGCLDTKKQAMSFLDEVDSIEEAMFVAEYDGYITTCENELVAARGRKLDDGSFRVALASYAGCDDSLRVILDVARDGTVKPVKSWEVAYGFGCW